MLNANKILKRATPGLREISKGKPSMFEAMYNCSAVVLDDMVMLYNTGKRHRESGRNKWCYLEFVATHDELAHTGGDGELPIELHMELVRFLYSGYCDGFDGVKR